MKPGIKGGGAEEYTGMPGTGRGRYFRRRNWYMGSSLRRRRVLSARSCGRISATTGVTDMISMPDMRMGLLHIRIRGSWNTLLHQGRC